MRNLLIGVFTLFWCALVFLVTFWLTFPSDTLVERVRWEVPERLGKEYSIDLASVSPWWVGLSAQDVMAGGMEQVGLAQPAGAVYEQGIVRHAGAFRDRGAGGLGEAVTRAGDEILEDIFPVQIGWVARGDVLEGREEFLVRRVGGLGLGQETHADESSGRVLGGFGEQTGRILAAVVLLLRAGGLDFQ